jgi:hypothetical protein
LKINVEVRFFHSLTVFGLAMLPYVALLQGNIAYTLLNETSGSYLSKKQLPYQN